MKRVIPSLKIIVLITTLILLVNLMPLLVFASETTEAADTMTLSVSSVIGVTGKTVQVTINLNNNPGLASLKFDVDYDDALTLTDVTFNSDFGPYVTAPEPYTNPQTITLISPLTDVSAEGTLATLTFVISEEASDNYTADISVTYDADDVYDGNYENIALTVVNGSVTIYRGLPGDIDGDSNVNTKDAILLFRYVAGWSVDVDSAALDVNSDNKVNTKDAVELFRYVAGWEGITLYRGEVCAHELTYTEPKSVTCIEDGNIAYWSCANCNRFYSDENGQSQISLSDTIIKAKGHTEVIDEAVTPTCTETGLTEGKHCSVCNDVLVAQEIVNALGHTEVIDSAVAPTCTATGLTEGKHCSVCGEILVAQTKVTALGHSYTSVITPPTATENGYTTYTCSVCGDTYTEAIVPTSFTVTADNRTMVGYTGEENENLVIPAVFEDNGTWYRVTIIDERAFDNRSNLTSVTIPNSITTISKYAFYNCSSLTSITIPDSVTSIGNSAFSGCYKLVEVINKSSLNIIAGSSSNGSVAYYAKEVHSDTTKIVNKNGYLFYTYNGVNYLLGYVGTDTALTLPENYNNEDYQIYKYAFYLCRNLTNITIPDGVTNIGDYAFHWCTSLTSVTIGDSVTNIGDSAFYGCSGLTSITIPDSVTSIGDDAFYNCSSLTSITIPDSVTSIGDFAFYGCSSLQYTAYGNGYYLGNSKNPYMIFVEPQSTSIASCPIYDTTKIIAAYAFSHCYSLTGITIPASVTSIGNRAFFYCESLTTITIPANVTSIDNGAFVGCDSLTDIIVSDGNNYYSSIDGNLYSKDGKTLILYAPGKTESTFIMPDSVTVVQDYAFEGAYAYLEAIAFSNNVTSINTNTIGSTPTLVFVSIGSGVTSIAEGAFASCYALREIYVHPDNAYYKSIDGHLYSKDEKTLVAVVDNGRSFENSFIIPNGVTRISSYAFCYDGYTTSITIPESVTSIGSQIFYNLPITRITFEGTIAQWNEIEKVSDWDLSTESYTIYCTDGRITKDGTVGYYYYDDTGLVFITNADGQSYSVIEIGTCTGAGIIIPSTCNGLPVTGIGCEAFYNCTNLTSVTIPNTVTSIGDSAFYGCSGLTSITIPDSITSIGDSAFYGCKNLLYNEYENAYYLGNASNKYLVLVKAKNTSIQSCVIHKNTKVVYYEAFEYCSYLTSITIPSNVTSIGEDAFWGCYKLVEVINKSSLNIIAGSSSNGSVAYYAKEVHSDTTKIVNKNGYLFYTYNGVNYLLGYIGTDTALTLPENYNSEDYQIYKYAFYKCSNLTNITIPDGVTSIGDYAFYGCSSLTGITIPDSVTSIGEDAFYNCSALTSIIFEDTSTWYRTRNKSDLNNMTGGTSTSVTNASTNATYFKSTYYYYYWYKK